MNSGKSTPSEFRVLFKESAYREFEVLDGSVKRKVAAQLLKIQENPLSGEPLGHKMGVNLTGYRKIYVDKKRIRIVWEVQAERVVVLVMGIGKREKGEIYKLIASRLGEKDIAPGGEPA